MYTGPDRKLNRAKFIDYSLAGFYYLTICTNNRIEWFGNVVNDKMVLNESGVITRQQLFWLTKQYEHVNLDEWIIMPNHVHVIIRIVDDVGTGRDRSLPRKTKPIPGIIGAFKTTSSKFIHQNGLSEFRWQKSYYDRVLRNQSELDHSRWYIRTNPERWHHDRNN
ncbi:transposase [Candidatus Falkowbacteria bacterium]|jgi:putative transposase|nr:transposase [Candidatus Falkowbacteria bacterium]MBT5503718.1 transposase [Candidatus Falkowbacteria bacterium]MBT6573802.1 transposase [Candidatus Falkowbacteria bacterium]MBT7348770.1 transposase [Candidatus Falkowbacteria bacterium]MBT7500560.1 transposase [Candidatus Falkowbacteria bacterium]